MKDLGFTETQQAIRSTIREYLEREVEPLVAEMEAERPPSLRADPPDGGGARVRR